ncbi:hypothetical protein [Shewanella xiamenensis]|uniref:hypothetical protein n=1 Tax=Shewanella xiamenensis TaxID=332186 RepID=UPI00294A605E|nr:hypothetical protein [Shewanella xiamenensis]MDV5249682.1 hypothetical protein [Shewanella xiamenensis]
MISSAPRSNAFCDWLTVTCSPDRSFAANLVAFLDYHSVPVSFTKDKTTGYQLGNGSLLLTKDKKFHCASASGATLGWLRENSLFRDYLNVLGEVPHNVTRLDASVDVAIDAPIVLRHLESLYPTDYFNFGRKALRISRLYSARPSDGQLTGTWYIGQRSKARVYGKVYDKQHEAFEKRGEVIPPTTRFELTFCKDYNCSLYDALMPESLFYAHASPKLLDLPAHKVLPWANEGANPWRSEPRDYALTLELFDKRVYSSPELLHIAELAANYGPVGKAVVMRHFERLLNSCLENRFSSPPESADKAMSEGERVPA